MDSTYPARTYQVRRSFEARRRRAFARERRAEQGGDIGAIDRRPFAHVFGRSLQFTGIVGISQVSTALELSITTAFFGLGFGGVMPLYAVALVRLFGAASLPRVMGIISPFLVPFSLFAPPFVGYLYDVNGDYQLAFRILLLFPLAAIATLYFLRFPDPHEAPA